MILLSREKVYRSAFVFLYLILIWFAQLEIVSNFSDIKGYGNLKVELFEYVLCALFVLVAALFFPVSSDRPSSFIIWLVFYFHVIPSVLFFHAVTDFGFGYNLYWSLSIVSIFLALSWLVNVVNIRIPELKITPFWSLWFVVVSSFFCFYILYRDFGFSVNPPSVFDVYGLRGEYKDNVSFFGGYAAIMSGYLFSPLLSVIACFLYIRRRYVLALCFIFIAAVLSYQVFSTAGFKSVAFMFFVVLAFFVLINRADGIGYGLVVSAVFTLLVIFSFLLSIVLDFDDLLLHWVRRSLIVPGMNSAYFFEYQFLYGFESDPSAPRQISEFYYGTSGSANSGFLGDGVYRFGVHFFWANILVLYLIAVVIDIFWDYMKGPQLALLLPAAYAFSNSTITSVLLTYGLFPMVFFVYFLRRFFRNA